MSISRVRSPRVPNAQRFDSAQRAAPKSPRNLARTAPNALSRDSFDAAPAARAKAPSTPASTATGTLAPLTQAEAQTIGSGFGTSRPPQTFWNDYATEMVRARGRDQGGITQDQMAKDAVVAGDVLGKGDGAAQKLSPADLAAAARAAGVPLSKQDPNQLVAATNFVNGAKDLASQRDLLTRALDNFNVLNTIGMPKLTQQEAASMSVDALVGKGSNRHGIDSAMLDKKMADPNARASALQDMAAAANSFNGETEVKVGDYNVKVNSSADGKVSGQGDKPGFWSKFGSVMGKVGKVALTVASVIPSPAMPFAIAANAAINAVNAIKNKSWVQGIVGVAGAFAGGVGALGQIAGSAVSTGLRTAANIAGAVGKVAGSVQQGLTAIKQGSVSGILGAVAGGASALAGGISSFAGGTADRLRGFADAIGKGAGAARAFDSARKGDVAGAIGGAAQLAGQLGAGGKVTGAISRGANVARDLAQGNYTGAVNDGLGAISSFAGKGSATGRAGLNVPPGLSSATRYFEEGGQILAGARRGGLDGALAAGASVAAGELNRAGRGNAARYVEEGAAVYGAARKGGLDGALASGASVAAGELNRAGRGTAARYVEEGAAVYGAARKGGLDGALASGASVAAGELNRAGRGNAARYVGDGAQLLGAAQRGDVGGMIGSAVSFAEDAFSRRSNQGANAPPSDDVDAGSDVDDAAVDDGADDAAFGDDANAAAVLDD